MPLNPVQRKTIREVLSDHIDSLLMDPAAEQHLPQVIENVALSVPEVIAYLKQHRHLIHDLMRTVNLDRSVRNDLNKLSEKLDSERPIIPQSLFLRAHPNHNPMYLVDMKMFGDALMSARIEEPYRSSLIALRELYLEMTPLSEANCYADESQVYKYRIGHVPLGLDKVGDSPSSGEISEEVLEYITLRLKWKKEYDARIEKLNEGTTPVNIKTDDGVKENEDTLPSSMMMKHTVEKQKGDDSTRSSSSPHIMSMSLCPTNDPLDTFIKGTSGDVLCYFGLKCQFGSAENNNMSKAIYWYTQAAEHDHLLALCILAFCYIEGLFEVEKNLRIGLEYLSKCERNARNNEIDLSFKFIEQMVSDTQNRELQFLMGVCVRIGGLDISCPITAAKWFRLSAEQGSVVGQWMLGHCLQFGGASEKNEEEAVKWLRSAADKGSAPAQNSLGDCFLRGSGVEQNYEEAERWFRLAADQGYPDAQNSLGNCYKTGKGVEKNYELAKKWYQLSADQGNTTGQYYLRQLSKCSESSTKKQRQKKLA